MVKVCITHINLISSKSDVLVTVTHLHNLTVIVHHEGNQPQGEHLVKVRLLRAAQDTACERLVYLGKRGTM